MSKKKLSVVAILAIVIVYMLGYVYGQDAPVRLGNIIEGQAYNSTTTTGVILTQLKTNSVGELGSVTIASSTETGTLVLTDATSTTDTTGTVIATFPANATAGTYTFDLTFKKGLIASSTTGFNGSYVTTWR